MLAHVPADFATAVGLFDEPLVAAGLELRPVVRKDIGRNDRRIVLQQAERAAQPHTGIDQGFGDLDADVGENVPAKPGDRLFDGEAGLAGEIAVGVAGHANLAHQLAHVDQNGNPLALVHVSYQDAADGDLVPLPVELQRVLGRVFGEADAEGRKREPDQFGIEVQVQTGQHRDDRRPEVVERPFVLLPVPFVDELGKELGRTYHDRIGHRLLVEPLDALGESILGRGSTSPVTHRGVGVEVHECAELSS